MPDSEPFSLGALGAILAVGGLVALMLAESPDPRTLALASSCLVGALVAFAVQALLRWRRDVAEAKAAEASGRGSAQVAAPGSVQRTEAGAPLAAPAGPARPAAHRAVLASVRVRRDTR